MGLLVTHCTGLERRYSEFYMREYVNPYISYKIIDSDIETKKLMLQRIDTNLTFQIHINELVSELEILYGLHPIEACYVGLEYSGIITEKNHHTNDELIPYPECRYGNYILSYENRDHKLCFINMNTGEELLMHPYNIVRVYALILQFDAVQSFYIGMLAGLQMHNIIERSNLICSYLKIIKL